MSDRILANRYRLTEQIGMGGMAIVYKAVDMRTGHNVAVKVLRPEFSEDVEFVGRFQREAEAASKMTHHNIVNLLDVGMDGDLRYLVMEYVQGKTLKEGIQERGRLSAPLACQITIRILSALEHAHRNGIVHRDIKPQNILVHDDGHIKVSDFGIARIADSSTLTRGDMVMGSVHYFSPEQARGKAANATSDLYSTGVVLYEMLTGRVPFDGENPVAVAMQHLHAQPVPIQSIAPDVPPSVVQICMKAMEKNPAMRYQSARDMAADLRLALDERGERPVNMNEETPVRQPPPQFMRGNDTGRKRTRKPVSRRTQKRVWRYVLLLGTLLAAAAVAIYGIPAMIERYRTRVELPDVTNLTKEEAANRLNALGVEVTFTDSYRDDYDAGVVYLQNPEAGQSVRKGSDKVALMVSLGPKTVTMPDVSRKTLSEATGTLNSIGIMSVKPIVVVNAEYPVNTVISTEPIFGTEIAKTTEVSLFVSGGSVTVPDLRGMTLQEAESAVNDSHLAIKPKLEYLQTENAHQHGLVASQMPDPTGQVQEGAQIALTIYQCESEIKQALLKLDVPEKDRDITGRITMQAYSGETGSMEDVNTVYEYVSYIWPADKGRAQNVTMIFPDSRNYLITVYFDDELYRTYYSSELTEETEGS